MSGNAAVLYAGKKWGENRGWSDGWLSYSGVLLAYCRGGVVVVESAGGAVVVEVEVGEGASVQWLWGCDGSSAGAEHADDTQFVYGDGLDAGGCEGTEALFITTPKGYSSIPFNTTTSKPSCCATQPITLPSIPASQPLAHRGSLKYLTLREGTLVASSIPILRGESASSSVLYTETSPESIIDWSITEDRIVALLPAEGTVTLNMWEWKKDQNRYVLALVRDGVGWERVSLSSYHAVVSAGGGAGGMVVEIGRVLHRSSTLEIQEEGSLIKTESYKSMASVRTTLSTRSPTSEASSLRKMSSSGFVPSALHSSVFLESLNLNPHDDDQVSTPRSSVGSEHGGTKKSLLRAATRKKGKPPVKHTIACEFDTSEEGLTYIPDGVTEPSCTLVTTSDCIAVVKPSEVVVMAFAESRWYRAPREGFALLRSCGENRGVPCLLVGPSGDVSAIAPTEFGVKVATLTALAHDPAHAMGMKLDATEIHLIWCRQTLASRDILGLEKALQSVHTALTKNGKYKIARFVVDWVLRLEAENPSFITTILPVVSTFVMTVLREINSADVMIDLRRVLLKLDPTKRPLDAPKAVKSLWEQPGTSDEQPDTSADREAGKPPLSLLTLPQGCSLVGVAGPKELRQRMIEIVLQHGVNSLLCGLNNTTIPDTCMKWLDDVAADGGYVDDAREDGHREPSDTWLCYGKVRAVLGVLSAELMLSGDGEMGVELLQKAADMGGAEGWKEYLHQFVCKTVNATVRKELIVAQGDALQLTETEQEAARVLAKIEQVLARDTKDNILTYNQAKHTRETLRSARVYPPSYNPVPAAFHPDTNPDEKDTPLELEAGDVTDFGITYPASSPRSGSKPGYFAQVSLSWAEDWPADISSLAYYDALRLKGDLRASFVTSLEEATSAVQWIVTRRDVASAASLFPQLCGMFPGLVLPEGPDCRGSPLITNMFDIAKAAALGTSGCSDTERGIRALSLCGGLFEEGGKLPSGFGKWGPVVKGEGDGENSTFREKAVKYLVDKPTLALSCYANAYGLWDMLWSTRPTGIDMPSLLYAARRRESNTQLFDIAILSEAHSLNLHPSPLPLPPASLNDIFQHAPTPIPGLVCLAYSNKTIDECLAAPPSHSHHIDEEVLKTSLKNSAALLSTLFPDALSLAGSKRDEGSAIPQDSTDATGLDLASTEGDASIVKALINSYKYALSLDNVVATTCVELASIPIHEPPPDASDDLELAHDFVLPHAASHDMLDIEYFLTRSRPAAAISHITNGASLDTSHLPVEDKQKYVISAAEIAFKNYESAAIVTAVTVFVSLLGVDPVRLITDVMALRRIAKYKTDPSLPVIDYFVSLSPNLLRNGEDPPEPAIKRESVRVLNLLEAATSLMSAKGAYDTREGDFSTALSKAESWLGSPRERFTAGLPKTSYSLWWLVVSFSQHHGLGKYTDHLETFVAAGDWSSLLSESQAMSLDTQEVTKLLVNATKGETRDHLLLALSDDTKRNEETKFEGNGPTSVLFETLLHALGMEGGGEYLLTKAVELGMPVLTAAATAIEKGIPPQKALVAWLLANRTDTAAAADEWASHSDSKDLQTVLAAEILAVCTNAEGVASHVVARAGLKIFAPSSMLVLAVDLAHAVDQRRWHNVPSHINLVLRGAQDGWEHKLCDEITCSLLRSMPAHHVVKLLEKLEEGGWNPLAYGFFSSSVLKGLSAKCDVSLLVRLCQEECIMELCKLNLYKDARMMNDMSDDPSKLADYITISEVLLNTVSACMHCKGLLDNKVALMGLFKRAGTLSTLHKLNPKHTALLQILCAGIVVNWFLPKPRTTVALKSVPGACPRISSVAGALALCVNVVLSRVSHLTSVDVLTAALQNTAQHYKLEMAPSSLSLLTIWKKDLEDTFCHVGRSQGVREALCFIMGQAVSEINLPDLCGRMNEQAQGVFPQLVRDKILEPFELTQAARATLNTAMVQCGESLPSWVGTVDKASANPTDDQLVTLAASIAKSETPLSKLPVHIVGHLINKLGADTAKILTKGHKNADAVIKIICGLGQLVHSVKAKTECDRLSVLARIAAHTNSNVAYLNDMPPVDLVTTCLKWPLDPSPQWSWHNDIATAKAVVDVYELSPEETAAAISKALIRYSYARVAFEGAANKNLTIMISDYMGSDPQSGSPTSAGSGKKDMRSVLIEVVRVAFEDTVQPAGDQSQQFDSTSTPQKLESYLSSSFSSVPQAASAVGVQQSHLLAMATLCSQSGESTVARCILSDMQKIKNKVLKLASEAGPPSHWARSVMLEPFVSALVHSSWLTEVDYDEQFVGILKGALEETVNECVQLNELKSAAPLLLSMADETFIDNLLPLILQRQSAPALLTVFQHAPRHWGEAQCMLYAHLQKKAAQNVSCREVLQMLHSKLDMHLELAELLESQAQLKMKEACDAYNVTPRRTQSGAKTQRKSRRSEGHADALRAQNMYLDKASTLLREAASGYLRSKSCASARRCLNLVDLIELQERFVLSDLRVICIGETSARAVLADITSFKDAKVVADTYGFHKTAEWHFAVYHQVIHNGGRVYWEDYFSNMPYSAELFKEIVQMYKNEKHGKREIDMFKFIMQDCKDKIYAEEALKKTSKSDS